MAYEKKITVTKGGIEAVIMESSTKVYERNGWTVADDGSSEEPEEAPPAKKAAVKKTTSKEG